MFLTFLKNNYADTYAKLDFHRADVLEGPIDFVILESIVIAIWGEVTQKSYAVDRLWSFLPTLTTGEQPNSRPRSVQNANRLTRSFHQGTLPSFHYCPGRRRTYRLLVSASVRCYYSAFRCVCTSAVRVHARSLLIYFPSPQCLWSWRLTYNTWRRGLYNS